MAKTNLFFNYYDAGDRQHEIDKCLEMNKLVFDEVVIVEGRPTFSELFALTKDYPNDINCFCNSDVYFKSTELLQKLQQNDCFALTRDDLRDDSRYNFQSQDAWCFKGEVKGVEMPYPMGFWGCDNRVVHELQRVGYNVINPSLSITIVHLHAVDNRVYERSEKNTAPPPYAFVKPTSI